MLHKRVSSLFLLLLILNLNMVVPAASYATADETCSCHLNPADHQCHCDDGCKSCGMHKKEKSEVNQQGRLTSHVSRLTIKGMTCSVSRQDDNMVLPVSAIPFVVPVFCSAVPMVQVSDMQNLTEKMLNSVTLTPSEKPPTV